MRIKIIQKIIDKLRNKNRNEAFKYNFKKSYSQSGEDLIVDYILTQCFKKNNINYLDIGAHHSTWLSNTRLFYDKGYKGVLVEPDPVLFKEIKKHRKNDICLNCGIGFENQENADFYIMEAQTLNTFDKETAYHNQKRNNCKIKEVVKIPLMGINNIFDKYFANGCDFCSLDVEGLEMSILNSLDFEKNRPLVFCIETLEYETSPSKSKKEEEIINFLKEKNYFVYADTYINTLLVDKNEWEKFC